MKKVVAIILFIGFAFSANAQESKKEDRLTLEQRNELHLKRMTIDLDLTEGQQKEMAKIIAENSQKREAKQVKMKANKEANKKLSSQERFELKSKALDEEKEQKMRMKKLLNEKQYEKWETKNEARKHRFHQQKRNIRKKEKKEVVK